MSDPTLWNTRILVLRAAEQAEATAVALRARGAEAITFPLIEIIDPPDPAAVEQTLRRLGDYDWVLFTSANGAARCFAVLERLGLDARAFAGTRVAAIGPKTAERLEAHGVGAELVAKQYVAEHLAAALLEQPAVRRVLLLRALVAREILPELLQQAGVAVDVVPVYETRTASADRAPALMELFEQRRVDVVLFTASSTVTAFAELLGERAPDALSRVTVASIGPITSETAAQAGLRVDVAASEHTIEGVLDALEAHFRSARESS